MGKTVLITGAALRVGREIALALADDGYDIAIHFNTSKKQASALASDVERIGRKAYLVQTDLQKPEQIKKIIPTLAKKGVKLDVLINNAAVFEKDNLTSFTPESWQQHMSTNLLAPLMLMSQFAEQYKGKTGNIINISDGMLGWSISPNFLSYSLSKMGLENATQLLSSELAPNIRVNAIAAGLTLEGKHDSKDAFLRLKKKLPLDRASSPAEVCDSVRYILSAPSLTGQVLRLAGGIR